jgi:hypothetical protein
MHVTGTFNEISSAVSTMTLDQRLLLSLVLGAICALIQSVIFPPTRLSTGAAQVHTPEAGCPHQHSNALPSSPFHFVDQLLPSVVLVSVANEFIFKSDSWPFSTPVASLYSLNAGKTPGSRGIINDRASSNPIAILKFRNPFAV